MISRESEIAELVKLYKKNKAVFLAVYGRRRVGKAFLIRQWFNKKSLYMEVVCTKNASMQIQLANFTQAISNTLG